MTTLAEPSDRRAHRRAPLDAPAMVEAPAACVTVRCMNVSPGGVALAKTVDIPIGTQVQLYFELPSGVGIDASAEVIRADGDLVAMRFVSLTRPQQIALRAHSRISGLHAIPTPTAP